jgi:ribosomal protein S18 acetylase RimI-like enzyme
MAFSSYLRSGALPARLDLSAVESARFGIPICRLEIGSSEGIRPADVLELFLASPGELCFLRYPARVIGWGGDLISADVALVPADTLLYHRLDRPAADRPAGLPLVAGPKELAAVAAAVRSTFSGYSNHYRANPLLPASSCEEGYVEWGCSLVGTEGCSFVWSGDDPRTPDAFGAVRIDDGTGEIVLAGVLPAARGRGAYNRLLADLEAHLWSEGAREVVISTQAWNDTVVRAWEHRGYRILTAFTTVHLLRGECRRALLEQAT